MRRTASIAAALLFAAPLQAFGGDASSADAGVPEPHVSAAPDKGITVTAGDAFSLAVKARMQLREVLSTGPTTSNTIDVHTLRVAFLGTVFSPDLKYVIQLAFAASDFDSTSPSPIFDAYFEYGGARNAQLRVGQYVVPFDRLRSIREYAQQLVDRSQMVTELNLSRDIGVSVFSEDLLGDGGRLTYIASVLGGNGRNQMLAEPMGLLYVARLGYRPFGSFDDNIEGDIERVHKVRLALGIAGAFNRSTTRQRSTSGNTFQLGTYNYAHAAADATLKYAGFSFIAEYLYRDSLTNMRSGTVSGSPVTEYTRSAWGYQFQAGMMLTKRIEIAGRWDQLIAIGATEPSLITTASEHGHEAALGLNFYLNGHFLKAQADDVVQFGNGASPAINLVRVQLDGTF